MAKDAWFFIVFFGVLLVLGFATQNGGIFAGVGNATSTATGVASSTLSTYPPENSNGVGTSTQTPPPTPPPPPLTPKEIEEKVARIYRELDTLTEELRVAKLQEPVSPYAGTIDLRASNARDINPDTEYLSLRANAQNTTTINISNWYLESYVTEEHAALPQGDRSMDRWRHPEPHDIFLEPGEDAYILTTESPINTSFHENMCTGYIAQSKTIYPGLVNSCPRPMDEMKRFAHIPLDDDSCYDFIERIYTCTTPTDDAIDDADLSRACIRLIETTLDYDSCVERHKNDPYFDDTGFWHIYLGEDDDLWREEREIIRLMDENDRVIDVIEY